MKILLDENLPRKLKFDFGERFNVTSVQEMNWQGKKNGELLKLMTLAGFDLFITLDRNIRHQQNVKKFSVKIFILSVINNKHQTLQALVPKLKKLLCKEIKVQIVELT